jgi:hypothetical protein
VAEAAGIEAMSGLVRLMLLCTMLALAGCKAGASPGRFTSLPGGGNDGGGGMGGGNAGGM